MNFHKHKEEKDYIQRLIKSHLLKNEKDIDWEVLNLIPKPFPGNKDEDALSAVYHSFKTHTNIPIELPIFCLFAYISAFLVKNNAKVRVAGLADPMELDLWLINLAQSGSSKSLSQKAIGKAMPTDENGKLISPNFEQCAGAAAFVEELKEKNRGFYIQDECGQLIKEIEKIGSPLHELKKYLLLTYDHSSITRKTKKETVEIEEPVLTLFWLNTIEGFVKAISDESLEDGFCQRFLYVWAMKDYDRPMEDFSLYNTQKIHDEINPEINQLFSRIAFDEYEISEEIVKYYKLAFSDISIKHFHQSISESFYRRVMFASYKYAVIFHLILGKPGNKIDFEDMTYALKTCIYHLYSLQTLLKTKAEGFTDDVKIQSQILKRVEEIKQKVESKDNRQVKARDIVRGCNAIKTAEKANYFLDLLAEKERLAA